MDRCELAWAAGFFDGEGWAAAVSEPHRRTSQPKARVNQADAAGVPAVLTRFQRALGGLGRLAGPTSLEGRVDLYRWEVTSRGDVEELLRLLSTHLGSVKLHELNSALGAAAVGKGIEAEAGDGSWTAWAAGLFDGEGWCSTYAHRSHQGYRSGEMGVTQSAPVGEPEVLTRFNCIAGVGRIYGPYEQAGATMPVFRWKAAAQRDVERVVAQLWPWLGPVKREQALRLLDALHSQPALPRGRPDWGSHKAHCINGHEYATTRVRVFVARGNGEQPRDSAQCLQCAREQARARREQKRRPAIDDDRRSL